MKIKILESSGWYRNFVGSEFEVDEYDKDSRLRFCVDGQGWVYESDCVITELPESFCVKRYCLRQKWKKYIKWLNKTYNKEYYDNVGSYYGCDMGSCWSLATPLGTEIHIDDMIKHIQYIEYHQYIKGGEQLPTLPFYKEPQFTDKLEYEFDLTTNHGRLAYAKKYYPIGTKYIPLSDSGQAYDGIEISEYKPRIWVNDRDSTNGIKVGRVGLIYHEKSNKWAEILKQEINMNTQKLSRKGLKEIHSVACSTWKLTLEGWGSRNPLEDYIELSQKEIDMMFNASDDNQKSILSKYLKQDDGSIDVTKFNVSGKGFCDNNYYIIRDREIGKYKRKSFLLSSQYSWEFREDEIGELCLIPTKKK